MKTLKQAARDGVGDDVYWAAYWTVDRDVDTAMSVAVDRDVVVDVDRAVLRTVYDAVDNDVYWAINKQIYGFDD